MVIIFKSEGRGHYGRLILPPAISIAKNALSKILIIKMSFMPEEVCFKIVLICSAVKIYLYDTN